MALLAYKLALGEGQGPMLGLRSVVAGQTKRMARSACRSRLGWGDGLLTSRRLERARRRGVLGEGLAVGEEDHESACKPQHRTGECQPRARQCALNSRCSGFERAMQAPSQAGRGLTGPSAWMSRELSELEHLGVPTQSSISGIAKLFPAAPPVPKSRVARWRGPPWRPSSVGWRPLTPEGGLARPYLLSWE